MVPAFYGDSTLISWDSDQRRNILVDGGPARTYRTSIRPMLAELIDRGEVIDLLVVTHIDHDHIGGILKMFEDVSLDKEFIKRIWFNSGNSLSQKFITRAANEREINLIASDRKAMSMKEGSTLENMLNKMNWQGELISGPATISIHEAKLHILSPTIDQLEQLNNAWEIESNNQKQMSSGKQSDYSISIPELVNKKFASDRSIANGSSISFLINVQGSSFLMLSDAIPGVVENNLRALNFNEKNKLKVDGVKVAHHGSKFNNSPELYSIIDCSTFLVSTDGSRDFLPHKEALSRIVTANKGCKLYFNYDAPSRIFSIDEKEQYDFQTILAQKVQL